MPRRTSTLPHAQPLRTAMDRVARAVRTVLFLIVGLLAVLTLSELPAVQRWTRGLGGRRPWWGWWPGTGRTTRAPSARTASRRWT